MKPIKSSLVANFFFHFWGSKKKFYNSFFSPYCAEFFKTVSVTTADKGNDNLMLISTGCSVTMVFYPWLSQNGSREHKCKCRGRVGRRAQIVKPSTFGTPLWRDKPIFKKIMRPHPCLCVSKNEKKKTLLPFNSIAPTPFWELILF